MYQARRPLIQVGQIYLSPAHDDYLIVTKTDRGEISYSGQGFRGRLEDETFIQLFPPVDPADVELEELKTLLSYCPPGTIPLVGFIHDTMTENED